jgi:hypothetical protein
MFPSLSPYFLFVLQQCDVTCILCIAWRFGAPQPQRHLDVHEADDTQRHHILDKTEDVTKYQHLLHRHFLVVTKRFHVDPFHSVV